MLGNWIRQTTTSTGTGNLTLSSVSGFPTFANQFATTDYFYYALLNDADGTPIEAGIGHLSDSTTLVRDKPLATFVSLTYSDNDPSAVSLAAGTKRVICSMEQGAMLVNPINISTVSTYKLLYPSGQIVPESASGTAMFLDIVVYIPTIIRTPRTIDAIQFRVSSAGSAGSVSKVGIYNSTLTGLPGARVDQSASIATDSSGVKVGTLTKRRYKPGLYFLAYTCSVAAPTCNIPAGTGLVDSMLGGDANMLTGNAAFYEGNATLTLPATANVTSGVRSISTIPQLAMRLA